MKYRLVYNAEKVTVNDMVAWEEAQATDSWLVRRNFLARFVEDEQGNRAPPEKGQEAVGEMTIVELNAVLDSIADTMREGSVNPQTGGA